MIIGTHILFYTRDADADRAFLRDVLGFKNVDVGHGWLIFKMPPAEGAVHPAEKDQAGGSPEAPGMVHSEVYFMCDDIRAEMKNLRAKGVECSPVQHERWGDRTGFQLPSGAFVGMYQPKHKTAFDLK
jgi:catechol 2,3-dioxygenase-like lactoylglutathione lyase family enzyme